MESNLDRRPGSLTHWCQYTDARGFPVEHCTGTHNYAEAEKIAAEFGSPSTQIKPVQPRTRPRPERKR